MCARPPESGNLRRSRFRYLRRTTIALLAGIALGLCLLLGLWKVLQSPFFCRRAADQIERAAQDLGGIQLDIGSLRWRLISPGILLENVGLQTSTMSFSCRRLHVGIGSFRFSRRTLVFSDVAAEGVNIDFKKLPKRFSSAEKSPLIRLIVEKLSLRGVSFNGEPKGSVVNVEGGELAWIREGTRSIGYFKLKSYRLKVAGLNDEIRGKLMGNFMEDSGRLRIPALRLRGTGLKLDASGEVSRAGAAGHLEGRLEIKSLDRMIRGHGLLSGSHLDLKADFNTAAKQFILFKITSPKIIVSHEFPLDSVSGELGLSHDELWGRVDHALFFGGRFHGDYRLSFLHGNFPHDVRAGCEGMKLSPFLSALGISTGGLTADMDVGASVTWLGRHFPKGTGHADISFAPRKGPLPVGGSLGLALNAGAFLEFNAQDLHLGHSRVDLQGPLQIGSWDPAWSIHADPASLDEILPAVNQWVGSSVFPPEIGGRGTLDLSLNGPWKRLQVGIHLDAHDLSWPPISIDRAALEAVVSEGAVEISRGHFRIGDGGGRVEGAIRWEPGLGEEELQLQIDGRDLPMGSVMTWAGLEGTVWSGALSFSGGLRGSLDSPSGSWALSARDMSVGGLNCGSGGASVELEDGVFRARRLNFDEGLRGDLLWDVMGRHFQADLGWDEMKLGSFSLLKHVFGQEPIEMNAHIDWALNETLPLGKVVLENKRSRLFGEISEDGLHLRGELGGALSARVEIPGFKLAKSWSGSGALQTEDLAALLRKIGGSEDLGLSGGMRLGLKLSGIGTEITSLETRIEETHVSFDTKPISLEEGGVLHWTPDGFELDNTRVATGRDELEIGGRLDDTGRLNGHLRGSLDARLLGFFLPEWEPAGSASGSVRLLGPLKAPFFEGSAHLKKASFHLPQTSVVLSDVGGDLAFSRGQVALDRMNFRILRGHGHGGGTIQMAEGPPLFALSGDIVGLEYPLFEGLVPRVSGGWHLGGRVGDFSLGGELTVDSAELRSRKDLPSLLLDWFGNEAEKKATSGLKLDLHVKSERSLLSRSPLIRLGGSADLHILGDAASPGLVGEITFEDGGEITVQGVRYEVEHAHLGFADPNSIETMVNIGLEARIQNYEVRVQLNGAAEHLVPVVSSDPPLSPQEIFSLMSVGSLGSGVGAGGAIGLSVASSMLSNRLQDVLESRDLWLLPIDQVRIDPFVENATGDPSARVTVVKQLSPNFTVTLQSDISAQKNQVITGRWYLGSGLFVEASRDKDREVGVDFKLRKRY